MTIMWYVQHRELIIIRAEYLHYAYHVKIYADTEHAKAWTAPGQSENPVSFPNRLYISILKNWCPSHRLVLRLWELLGKPGSSYLP